MEINIDPTTTKYVIRARITADGIIEKPDVVGAIFGQTEGLLGEDMDLRDLQKSGRIGRIEADVKSQQGKSSGEIFIPSSLDQIETAIIAASLETIDRVGPCKSRIEVITIEDSREVKKKQIAERAKVLLRKLVEHTSQAGGDIAEEVKKAVVVEDIVPFGPERLPAGPNVASSDAVIVVEGRSDVLNLLRHGVKNAVAVEGTHVPQSIIELSKEKVVTAFVDGDRGGELILRELLQVAELDFICRAPRSHEVEELTQKQLMKALKDKIPADQFTELYGIGGGGGGNRGGDRGGRDRNDRGGRGGDRGGRGGGRGPRDFDPRRRDYDDRREREPPREEGDAPSPDTPEAPAEGAPESDSNGQGGDGSQAAPAGGPSFRPGLNPEQLKLAAKLQALQGAQKAAIFEETGAEREVPLMELPGALAATTGKIRSIVFDGIISQRILDLASAKGAKTVVGLKLGQVVKAPESVEVLTAAELGA
jgi:DNA primase